MADVKISQLPAVTKINNGDAIPIVQNGATKKVSGSILKSFVQSVFSYASGTYSERGHACGYTTGTSGTLYVFFDLQKLIPDGATISNVQVTSATIRCNGKTIANNGTLTSNIDTVSSYMGGTKLNLHFTGLTTNFTATSVLSFIGTVTFTITV